MLGTNLLPRSCPREKPRYEPQPSIIAEGRNLGALLAEAAKFLSAAKARSTREAYASDTRDFNAFC
jgi:hypothetical protein